MFDHPRLQALPTMALLASLGAMLLAALACGAGAADAVTYATRQTAGSAHAAVRALPSRAASAGSSAATDDLPASPPQGLIAALADRLIASPSVSGPMQFVDRLIASQSILGSASDPAPLASASHTRLPPDLIALERKMRGLHIDSERGSIVLVLSGVNLRSLFTVTSSRGSRPGDANGRVRVSTPRRGHDRRSRRKRLGAQRALGLLPSFTLDVFPLLTADFESSVSPKLAIVRAQLLGAISLQTREIGEQTYTRNPFVAEVNGGRPWVSESAAERAQTESKAGGESFPVPHIVGPDGASEFQRLIVQLDDARSVVDLGSRTVDGQATTEFEAKLDSRWALGGLFAGGSKGGSQSTGKGASKGTKNASKSTRKGGSKGAQRRPKQAAKGRLTQREKRLERTKVTLDLYLASNGLPVRTMLDIRRGEVGVTFGLDIFATEIPIVVQPPPPSETITGAELKKAEESSSSGLLSSSSPPHHLTKREKAEERRFGACMNRRLRMLRRHRLKRLGRRRAVKIVHECERRARLPSRPAHRHSHAGQRGR